MNLTVQELQLIRSNLIDKVELDYDVLKKGPVEMCVGPDEYDLCIKDHNDLVHIVQRIDTYLVTKGLVPNRPLNLPTL